MRAAFTKHELTHRAARVLAIGNKRRKKPTSGFANNGSSSRCCDTTLFLLSCTAAAPRARQGGITFFSLALASALSFTTLAYLYSPPPFRAHARMVCARKQASRSSVLLLFTPFMVLCALTRLATTTPWRWRCGMNGMEKNTQIMVLAAPPLAYLLQYQRFWREKRRHAGFVLAQARRACLRALLLISAPLAFACGRLNSVSGCW